VVFVERLTVLSVPEKKPIAHGRYVLEALGAGVPVVEPALGVFPELLELTGGGVLYDGNTPQALAETLKPLLLDSGHAQQLGQQGREGVCAHFNITQTTQDLVRLYEGHL
jgi:glycosyltransferase involved in cell wall biosynthesis